MGTVPEAYYNFIMDYAPYPYIVPPNTPDPNVKAVIAAAFAIDFLYEAYNANQFSDRKTAIYNKIVSLADWVLTQQCTNSSKKAYGGFKSDENSTYYYSVDACRVIPSLLKAYELTKNSNYLNAAKLAAGTFLKTMQDQQPYGGFARAVDIDDNWLLQLDIECLYGLIGLKMLAEKYDVANASLYQSMMSKAVNFLRDGFENLWLYFDPSDGEWHRIGLNENEVYDDCFAYALLGLYEYEGWSLSCQKVYNFINTIRASAQHPAYNPAICWAGYIDVATRFPACNFYDAVTSGILWKIRAAYDKPSLAYSMQVINKHQSEFMFWGPKFDDYSPIENKWSMVTVCWLARFFLNYADPVTNFTRLLDLHGENLQLYPVREATDKISYGEPLDVKGVVMMGMAGEIIIESGYMLEDHITVYTFLPIRVHDKIKRAGVDYEVKTVQCFMLNGQPEYYKSVCRRLITQ